MLCVRAASVGGSGVLSDSVLRMRLLRKQSACEEKEEEQRGHINKAAKAVVKQPGVKSKTDKLAKLHRNRSGE